MIKFRDDNRVEADIAFLNNYVLADLNNGKKHAKNEYPGLPPKSVLRHYSDELTPFEKNEILDYNTVYCFGMTDKKEFVGLNSLERKKYTSGYKLIPSDHLDYRYLIGTVFDRGEFSQVARATDCRTKKQVIIKVFDKSSDNLIYNETRKLIETERIDPAGKFFARMVDFNQFRSHHYIVLEPYEMTLRDYIQQFCPKGLPMEKIQSVMKRLFEILVFLEKNNLVHANIAPEHIVFNRSHPDKLKLCNFNFSFYSKENRYHTYLQSLHYRAPEVFCGCTPTTAIDTWSVGCIMAEMVLGKKFMEAGDSNNQFYRMLEVMGLPPKEFYKINHRMNKFFFLTSDDAPRHCVLRHDAKKGYILAVDFSQSHIEKNRLPPNATPLRSFFRNRDHTLFRNLVVKCFKWMPDERIRPEYALLHPFFTYSDN